MSGCCQVLSRLFLFLGIRIGGINQLLFSCIILSTYLLYCQVTVPLGELDGFPTSISFIAFHGADLFLLDTVLDCYSTLLEQAKLVSESKALPETNGDMDASELLKEKVCSLDCMLYFKILKLHLF